MRRAQMRHVIQCCVVATPLFFQFPCLEANSLKRAFFVKYFSLAIQKIFFKGLQAAPNRLWISRAEKLGVFEQFYLHRDGARVRGIIISPNSNHAHDYASTDTVVILSHPITRKAKYFFTESGRAKTYLDRGCHVIAFDYNGFGESDRIDLFYWRDVAAIIEYAQQKFPDKKIILHGASFGAFHIVRALERLPANSRVILENVNKSLFSYWRKWPLTRIGVTALQLLRVRSIREMDVQQAIRKLKRADLDIRFIACESDDMTTLVEMRELYSLLTSTQKKFFVFDGATHLSAPAKNPQLYASALFEDA
jgi:uncharacterized protein